MVATADGANLIMNYDFELGDTAFETDYNIFTAGSSPAVCEEAEYAVVQTAYDVHPAWSTLGDHTTGEGNFFVANGSADTSKTVWQSSSAIDITAAGTAYRFEAYITSVYSVGPGQPGPTLTFQVGNGSEWYDMGTSLSFPNGYTPGTWRLSFYDGIFSSVGSYYVRLLNSQSALGGNDLGVDDLYFGLRSEAPSVGENPGDLIPQGIDTDPILPVPEPATLSFLLCASTVLYALRRQFAGNASS